MSGGLEHTYHISQHQWGNDLVENKLMCKLTLISSKQNQETFEEIQTVHIHNYLRLNCANIKDNLLTEQRQTVLSCSRWCVNMLFSQWHIQGHIITDTRVMSVLQQWKHELPSRTSIKQLTPGYLCPSRPSDDACVTATVACLVRLLFTKP